MKKIKTYSGLVCLTVLLYMAIGFVYYSVNHVYSTLSQPSVENNLTSIYSGVENE